MIKEKIRLFLCVFISFALHGSVVKCQGSIAQPDIVFYGQVQRSTDQSNFSVQELVWTIASPGKEIEIADAAIYQINNSIFYVAAVPVGVDSLGDGTALPVNPGELVLDAGEIQHYRSAAVNGIAAQLDNSESSFTYGVPSMGLVEKIDLVLLEPYADWCLRYFGVLLPEDGNADGDVRTNFEEYQDGTDPTDREDAYRIKDFQPIPGGIRVTWDGAAGRTYVIERSFNMGPHSWEIRSEPILCDGNPVVFEDSRTDNGRVFYRIREVLAE